MPAGDIQGDTDLGGLAVDLLRELVVVSVASYSLVQTRKRELKTVTSRSPFLLTHLCSSFVFPRSAITERGAI